MTISKLATVPKVTYYCDECDLTFKHKYRFDHHPSTKKHKDKLLQIHHKQEKINKK